jgi:1-acyl-sn-glycerol-3-phosphate acyltransferase
MTRPPREPLASLALYHMLKWSVVSPLLHTYFRGRIHNADRAPRSGKLLVVSNHASDFDPLLVANCINRPIAFMAKEELFQVPVLKHAMSLYGAYPVRRGSADRTAMKSAIIALEAGWATGVFLDGTRTIDGRIHSPKLGAAWIAAQTQTPILPVCLWGNDSIFRKGSPLPRSVPLTIRMGELILPPERTDRALLEATTQQCAAVINGLHDQGR